MSLACYRVLRALVIATFICAILIFTAQRFGPSTLGKTIPDRPDGQHEASRPDSPPPFKPDQAPPVISHPPLGTPTSASASAEAPPAPEPTASNIADAGSIPGIQGKIWQTSKAINITEEELSMTETWLAMNPTFRHERLTDEASDNYVRLRYASQPDIVALYTGLTVPILRADLLRYLILLADGGVWADLDTTCEQAVKDWLPAEIYNANSTIKAGLVLGLEPDSHHGGLKIFTNGVFAARAGSKHLKAVVDVVVRGLYDIAKEHKVEPKGITLEMVTDVLEVTGRKKMTATIIESLSKTLGKKIGDTDLTDGNGPKHLDDVIILPVPSFASYDGNPNPHGVVLVTHHHAGTWKDAAAEAEQNRQKLKEEEAERLKKAAEEAERKNKEMEDNNKEDKDKKAKEEQNKMINGEENKQTENKQTENKKPEGQDDKKAEGEGDKKTQL